MPSLPADPLVDLNGRLLPASVAGISPLSEGFLYGHGLFETIKIGPRGPVFFAEHWERLRRGAADLGLALRSGAAEWLARSQGVIAANAVTAGSLKLVVFQDHGGPGELILLRAQSYGAEAYAKGFRLRTVADPGSGGGLGALKTLNYLRHLTAKRAAQAAGFDEPLFVAPDGALLEGAGTNVFVVRAGVVTTPPLDGRILPGIARAKVLALLGGAEARIAAEDLAAAQEVFVTNSLMGVMPVVQVDDLAFAPGGNPVTQAAMAAWRILEAGSGEARAAAGA